MVDLIKEFVNFLSSPTVSFTLLTVSSPFLFPPTDWFEKYHYKFKLNYLWKKRGWDITVSLSNAIFDCWLYG